jgi:hypothetical protein
LYIPEKIGRIVQLQTASIPPETEAIEYDIYFFVLTPKYLKTLSFDMNAEIAPAMKKAGIRQVNTCSER